MGRNRPAGTNRRGTRVVIHRGNHRVIRPRSMRMGPRNTCVDPGMDLSHEHRVDAYVAPELLEFDLLAGGTNAICTAVSWQPIGYLRFGCYTTDPGGTKLGYISALGTASGNLSVPNLTVGNFYTLFWILNCEPDVPGWNDGAWRFFSPQIQWTQPGKRDPAYEHEYRSES